MTDAAGTICERPPKPADLDNFVTSYGSDYGRGKRVEPERFRRYGYDNLARRVRLDLELLWLKDASAIDPETLPLAAEIVDSLETALEKFAW